MEVGVWGGGQNLPQQLRAWGGTPPGQDAHPPQATHTPTGAQTGTAWTGQFTSGAPLREVGETGVPPRQPTQAWGEHANPREMAAWAGNPFLLPHQRYNKTALHEQCFLKTRCIYQFLKATISLSRLNNE